MTPTDIGRITFIDDHGESVSAYDHLLKGGNLTVPCSRYGHDTETCAIVAIMLFHCFANDGSELSVHALEGCMSLAVNDADGIDRLLADNHDLIRTTLLYKGEPMVPEEWISR